MQKLVWGQWVGVNYIKALETLKFIPSKNNGPYAYKTPLGWYIVGQIETCKINKREINCNLMTVQQAPNLKLTKHFLAVQVRVKDVGIGNLLKKVYEANFSEIAQELVMDLFNPFFTRGLTTSVCKSNKMN